MEGTAYSEEALERLQWFLPPGTQQGAEQRDDGRHHGDRPRSPHAGAGGWEIRPRRFWMPPGTGLSCGLNPLVGLGGRDARDAFQHHWNQMQVAPLDPVPD